ncbi:hypothetical protein B0H34DRAFT_207091 [Crassisporium funariophilum]|nr:hypothetical protein B0H34DRAFT_207091 [Crassisporium funariophilum]
MSYDQDLERHNILQSNGTHIRDDTLHRQNQRDLPEVPSSTPAFATNVALEEVKDSIRDIRALLIDSRGYLGQNLVPMAAGQWRDRPDSVAKDVEREAMDRHPQVIHVPQPMSPVGYFGRRRSPSPRPQQVMIQAPSTRTRSPIMVMTGSRRTEHELQSVISDFSSIVIIVRYQILAIGHIANIRTHEQATFLVSVSVVMLSLARTVVASLDTPKTSLNKTLNIILQIFGSLSLSFNLSVAIVAGGAASSQSLRLRLKQRASEFSESQALETRLQLCSTLQYYGLLALAVATACLFGLLLNSPYAILMIIPVIGVIFYESLFRGKMTSSDM